MPRRPAGRAPPAACGTRQYVSRPPARHRATVADRESGQLRYSLQTPFRDGTTHVIFEPQDFIARLASLVPRPGAHLTRYHGIFAPASALWAQVVVQRKPSAELESNDKSEAPANQRNGPRRNSWG